MWASSTLKGFVQYNQSFTSILFQATHTSTTEKRSMSRPLANQVAIVTGASRGIGRGIALKLASQGAAVGIVYQSAEDAAQQVLAFCVWYKKMRTYSNPFIIVHLHFVCLDCQGYREPGFVREDVQG
jgi:3-oxoacyl-ACP reductase-like protein